MHLFALPDRKVSARLQLQVHVDIRNELKGISLEKLSMDSLPEGSKVDQLASELQGLKAAGHSTPFVYVGIKKHIPRWAATDSPAASEGNPLACCFCSVVLLVFVDCRRWRAGALMPDRQGAGKVHESNKCC